MTDMTYSSIREIIDSYDFNFDRLWRDRDVPFCLSLERQRESIQLQIDTLKLLQEERSDQHLYLS